MSWASGEPKDVKPPAAASAADADPLEPLERGEDYESLILTKLRQAEERKRQQERESVEREEDYENITLMRLRQAEKEKKKQN